MCCPDEPQGHEPESRLSSARALAESLERAELLVQRGGETTRLNALIAEIRQRIADANQAVADIEARRPDSTAALSPLKAMLHTATNRPVRPDRSVRAAGARDDIDRAGGPRARSACGCGRPRGRGARTHAPPGSSDSDDGESEQSGAHKHRRLVASVAASRTPSKPHNDHSPAGTGAAVRRGVDAARGRA